MSFDYLITVNDNGTMFGRLSWLDKRVGTGDLNAALPLWVLLQAASANMAAANVRSLCMTTPISPGLVS